MQTSTFTLAIINNMTLVKYEIVKNNLPFQLYKIQVQCEKENNTMNTTYPTNIQMFKIEIFKKENRRKFEQSLQHCARGFELWRYERQQWAVNVCFTCFTAILRWPLIHLCFPNAMHCIIKSKSEPFKVVGSVTI